MLFALLVCTDNACAAQYEAYGTPDELLDGLTCELCGCPLQVVGWAEGGPSGPAPSRPRVQLLDAA